MRIKIGDKIYDPNDEPIMAILTAKDRENITNMRPPEATDDSYYCSYPETMTPEEATEFMFVKESEKTYVPPITSSFLKKIIEGK